MSDRQVAGEQIGQVEHRGEDQAIDGQQAQEQGLVTAAPDIGGDAPENGNRQVGRQDLANIGVEATRAATNREFTMQFEDAMKR